MQVTCRFSFAWVDAKSASIMNFIPFNGRGNGAKYENCRVVGPYDKLF